MANHSNTNIISQVQLDKLYDIHDMHAIHTIEDLASLGMNTENLFSFQGTVATYADLPTEGNVVGHVYHVTENHSEYIWAKVDGGSSEGWEEFGVHLVVTHTHNIPQLVVEGSNQASAVSGKASGALTKTAQSDIKIKATATTTNVAIGKNGTAAAITEINPTTLNLEKQSINSAGANVTASKVSSTNGKLVTTSIKGVAGTANVVNSVTPSKSTLSPTSITGVSGSVTASKATAGTVVSPTKTVFDTSTSASKITAEGVAASKVTLGTAISVAPAVSAGNVSKLKTAGNVTAGTDPSWSASVDSSGILSFNWSKGAHTAVTLPTFDSVAVAKVGTAKSIPNVTNVESVSASNITSNESVTVPVVKSNNAVNITPYTFNNVTVPVAATSATSVAALSAETSIVTDVSTNTATVATAASSNTTVATGSVTSSGTGSAVITSVTANDVTAAGPATAVSVATGALSTSGAGDAVVTGFDSPTTSTVLTGVKVTTQPTVTVTLAAASDGVKTGEAITFGTGELSVSGTAAAQAWSGKTKTGTTGNPV